MEAKAETQEGEEGGMPSPCVFLAWSVQLRKSMPIPHLSLSFCFRIRLQSNRFPHACSCKLNSRCSSSPLFPSITLPYCPCLYLFFFAPVFCLQLSVVFCLLPSIHYQKFSPFLKLKKSFVRNILKFAVLILCLPLLYQIH